MLQRRQMAPCEQAFQVTMCDGTLCGFSCWFAFSVMFNGASLVAQKVRNLPAMLETQVQSLGREDPWRRKWRCLCLMQCKLHAKCRTKDTEANQRRVVVSSRDEQEAVPLTGGACLSSRLLSWFHPQQCLLCLQSVPFGTVIL